MSPPREHWGSRLGFVMAAAGSAVGLGNIWKFPYMAGDNGGGAFLILYLLFVVVFGLSLVMAELAIGRAAQRNPVGAYRMLAGRGWPLIGAMGLVAAFMILSFYIVIAGWTVAYLGFVVDGAIARSPDQASALDALFNDLVAGVWRPLIYAAVFMIATAIVVAGGVGRGIERASKLCMPGAVRHSHSAGHPRRDPARRGRGAAVFPGARLECGVQRHADRGHRPGVLLAVAGGRRDDHLRLVYVAPAESGARCAGGRGTGYTGRDTGGPDGAAGHVRDWFRPRQRRCGHPRSRYCRRCSRPCPAAACSPSASSRCWCWPR